MVAISIIVSTRGDLATNDRPAAHVAAGVPVGVAINKRRSHALRRLRDESKQRKLPSVGLKKSSRQKLVIDERRSSARQKGISTVRSRSRVRHRESYILLLGILGLYAKRRET